MPNPEYTLLVALSVYRNLSKLGRPKRDRILAFFDQLEESPYGLSHYRENDSAGSPREVTIVGDHAVTYWVDYTDKHVKVLRIESAGT